jgi:hypothetical protein
MKGGTAYKVLFGLMSLLFLGILLFVFVAVKQAAPVMLDEQGRRQGTP